MVILAGSPPGYSTEDVYTDFLIRYNGEKLFSVVKNKKSFVRGQDLFICGSQFNGEYYTIDEVREMIKNNAVQEKSIRRASTSYHGLEFIVDVTRKGIVESAAFILDGDNNRFETITIRAKPDRTIIEVIRSTLDTEIEAEYKLPSLYTEEELFQLSTVEEPYVLEVLKELEDLLNVYFQYYIEE